MIEAHVDPRHVLAIHLLGFGLLLSPLTSSAEEGDEEGSIISSDEPGASGTGERATGDVTPPLPGSEAERDAKARASLLVNDGNNLFEKGQIKDALSKYEAAYRAYPSPKILFNIGEAHNELGDAHLAATCYERFLAEAGVEPGSAIEDQVRGRLEALQPKLAFISFEGDASGAEISIDEKIVGATPLDPIRVAPGQHRIAASLEGHETFRTDVLASAGSTVPVAIEMKSLVALGGGVPPSENGDPESLGVSAAVGRSTGEPRSLTEEWWFWTAIGAIAIAAAGTIVFAAGGGGDDFVPRGEFPISSTADWMRF